MFAKIAVTGPGQPPALPGADRRRARDLASTAGSSFRSAPPKPGPTPEVHWNFEKFLIDRDGTVVGRFGPDTEPRGPGAVRCDRERARRPRRRSRLKAGDRDRHRGRDSASRPVRALDRAPRAPGVILYMDAFGPRPALDAMAERLAARGLRRARSRPLLAPAPYGPFAAGAFAHEPRGEIMGLIRRTPQEMTRATAPPSSTARRPRGRTANRRRRLLHGRRPRAARPPPPIPTGSRPRRASTAATSRATSPTARTRRRAIKAPGLCRQAGVDRGFPPEQSARLAEALRRRRVDHVIENYVGMATAGRARLAVPTTRTAPNATGSGCSASSGKR